jgi:hypothetical protein
VRNAPMCPPGFPKYVINFPHDLLAPYEMNNEKWRVKLTIVRNTRVDQGLVAGLVTKAACTSETPQPT